MISFSACLDKMTEMLGQKKIWASLASLPIFMYMNKKKCWSFHSVAFFRCLHDQSVWAEAHDVDSESDCSISGVRRMIACESRICMPFGCRILKQFKCNAYASKMCNQNRTRRGRDGGIFRPLGGKGQSLG